MVEISVAARSRQLVPVFDEDDLDVILDCEVSILVLDDYFFLLLLLFFLFLLILLFLLLVLGLVFFLVILLVFSFLSRIWVLEEWLHVVG